MNERTRTTLSEIATHSLQSEFNWIDLFSAGIAPIVTWTSTYTESGACGESELATAEKGREAFEEAVKQLARLVTFFHARPKEPR